MLFMKRQSDTRALELSEKVRNVNVPRCFPFSQIPMKCFFFLHAGTLGMTPKTKKEIRSLESTQKRTPKKHDVRRCITARATMKDKLCTMKLCVYMLYNNEWYLQCLSCLDHCCHPPFLGKAKAKSSVDMSPNSKTLVSTSNQYFSISKFSILMFQCQCFQIRCIQCLLTVIGAIISL